MVEIHGGGLNLKLDIGENKLENLQWENFINLTLLPPPLVLTDRISVKAIDENTQEVLNNLNKLKIGMILKSSKDNHFILVGYNLISMEGNLTINRMLNSSISTVIDSNMSKDSRLANMGGDKITKLKSIVLNSIEIKKSTDPSLDINSLYNELINLLV